MNFCAFLCDFGTDSLFLGIFPPHFSAPFLWQGRPPFWVVFYKKMYEKNIHSAPPHSKS